MSVAAKLRSAWETLRPLPGGKQLFSLIFGQLVPYTGTVGLVVDELRPGFARLQMADRRGVRNHLKSIHAIALMNLAEATTGLAMNYAMPADARAIVTGLSIAYTKKARGRISAECQAPAIDYHVAGEHVVETVLRDASGDEVARASARWLVSPKPAGS